MVLIINSPVLSKGKISIKKSPNLKDRGTNLNFDDTRYLDIFLIFVTLPSNK